MNLRQRIILILALYPVVVYAIAYLSLCLNPYWYDNSPRPLYIPWSERWLWVLWPSFLYILVGLPLLFATIALILYIDRRKH
jgi:hypothetical protein